MFVGIAITARDEAARIATTFRRQGFDTVDLTDDELAKEHVRHMVGGPSPLAQDERLLRFVFPERPGALLKFLSLMQPNWNISLFHYRNQGADYGQILSGQLDDDNTNGIPDVCETSVTGVIPPSVPAQGGATVTIKGYNFPENPTVLIGGLPATNVMRLSATRITANSPALLPGMTSISVNGFTLPDALYIRPECGSDLDQDGVVGAGDIAIVLLNFGACTAAQAAPTEPLIFERPESSAAPTQIGRAHV